MDVVLEREKASQTTSTISRFSSQANGGGREMTKPYSAHKLLPKMRAEQKRLERLAASNLPEAVTKYIEAAHQKLGKAITLLEEEKNEKVVS